MLFRSAIGLFGAAVAYKIGKGLVGVFNGVKSLFGTTATTAQTGVLMTPLDLIASNTTDMVGLLSKGFFPNGGGPTLIKTAETAGGGAATAETVAKLSIRDMAATALDYLPVFLIAAGQKNALPTGTSIMNSIARSHGYSAEEINGRTFYFPNATINASGAKFNPLAFSPLNVPGLPGTHNSKPKPKGKVTINFNAGFHT